MSTCIHSGRLVMYVPGMVVRVNIGEGEELLDRVEVKPVDVESIEGEADVDK